MSSPSSWVIPPLNEKVTEHVQQAIDNKTKPPGSLGKLESLALQLAKTQLTSSDSGPLVIEKPAILVFAADHGISRHNVSIAPAEVTQQMVLNFLAGGAAINCFCGLHDVQLSVIDAGMLNALSSTSAHYFEHRLGAGTQDISVQDAMSQEQLSQGLNFGAQIAKLHIEAGSNVLGFGEMGIGNTSSAAALLCAYSGLEASKVVGRGTGISDAQYDAKVELIQRSLDRVAAAQKASVNQTEYILAALGGFEIVQMIGAMLATAEQGKTVVVDGFIASVAALYACAIAPRTKSYMVFAHVGAERSHQMVLNLMNVQPLLDLGMRLGEGTGAALAMPMLRSAVAFYNEMATFESANVDV